MLEGRVPRVLLILTIFLILVPVNLSAESIKESENIAHQMNQFVLQIAVILIAATGANKLFSKLRLPPVTGEIIIGIIIGPYLLGAVPIGHFSEGLFNLPSQGVFPVSMEIITLVTLASILHLFIAGLETDVRLLLKFSSTGFFVGIIGALLSFFLGAVTAMVLLKTPFLTAPNIFLGLMSSVTSVGITTRILSDHRKLVSPEGITIIESAVTDDLLGIIMLTVALGYFHAPSERGEGLDWGAIAWLLGKAFLLGATITAGGMLFSRRIAAFLRAFKSSSVFAVFAFATALLIGAFFEEVGLVSIVGAYIVGLILSKTELHYVLKENLESLNNFLIPIFFTVMGMLIDIRIFLNRNILLFGLIYTLGCILSKFLGCGIPSLFLRFNWRGALRIGLGMIPRGEMVFVLAGTWLSYGVIGKDIFGIAMVMTFLTTILGPPLFSYSLKSKEAGSNLAYKISHKVTASYDYPSEEIRGIFVEKILENFKAEGFFIYTMRLDTEIYRINKEEKFISLFVYERKLVFKLEKADINLLKVLMYESYLQIVDAFNKLHEVKKPTEMIDRELESHHNPNYQLGKILEIRDIVIDLQGETKEEVIRELIDRLERNNKLVDKQTVVEDVLSREESMSTGLEHGLALPHAKTKGVNSICMAVGLNRTGLDFQALDRKPSKVIILLLAPKDNTAAYLEILSLLAGLFATPEAVEHLLDEEKQQGIHDFFVE